MTGPSVDEVFYWTGSYNTPGSGGSVTWTVPVDVYQVTVNLWGGGHSGMAVVVLDVVPGEVIGLKLGGPPHHPPFPDDGALVPGSFNGGGRHWVPTGCGGGRSDLLVNGELVAVAGGSGGGSDLLLVTEMPGDYQEPRVPDAYITGPYGLAGDEVGGAPTPPNPFMGTPGGTDSGGDVGYQLISTVAGIPNFAAHAGGGGYGGGASGTASVVWGEAGHLTRVPQSTPGKSGAFYIADLDRVHFPESSAALDPSERGGPEIARGNPNDPITDDLIELAYGSPFASYQQLLPGMARIYSIDREPGHWLIGAVPITTPEPEAP